MSSDTAPPESPLTSPEVTSRPVSSSPWKLLGVWLALGAQSFGGGMATLALIRRAAVEQQGWVTEAEFTRFWAICQIAPGINLLALAILIGRKAGGAWGVVVALIGLLLPSVTITALMTAGYRHIRDLPITQAALRGVIPAIVGLGLLTSWQMARAPLRAGRQEGLFGLSVSLLLLFGSAVTVAVWRLPVIAILCGAGSIGALYQWGREYWLRKERSDP